MEGPADFNRPCHVGDSAREVVEQGLVFAENLQEFLKTHDQSANVANKLYSASSAFFKSFIHLHPQPKKVSSAEKPAARLSSSSSSSSASSSPSRKKSSSAKGKKKRNVPSSSSSTSSSPSRKKSSSAKGKKRKPWTAERRAHMRERALVRWANNGGGKKGFKKITDDVQVLLQADATPGAGMTPSAKSSSSSSTATIQETVKILKDLEESPLKAPRRGRARR